MAQGIDKVGVLRDNSILDIREVTDGVDGKDGN